MLDGLGEREYANGYLYRGEWNAGEVRGAGELIRPGREALTGIFMMMNGKIHLEKAGTEHLPAGHAAALRLALDQADSAVIRGRQAAERAVEQRELAARVQAELEAERERRAAEPPPESREAKLFRAAFAALIAPRY